MAKEYFEIALFGYQWTDPSWDERLQQKMEQQVGVTLGSLARMAKKYFEIALFGYQRTDPSCNEGSQQKMEEQVGVIYTYTREDADELYEQFVATGEIPICLCRDGSLTTVCFKSPDPYRNAKGLLYTQQKPGYFVSLPDKKDGSYWVFYTRTTRIVRK